MKNEEILVSVIIPAYNEEAMIEKAASAISQILEDSRIPWVLETG